VVIRTFHSSGYQDIGAWGPTTTQFVTEFGQRISVMTGSLDSWPDVLLSYASELIDLVMQRGIGAAISGSIPPEYPTCDLNITPEYPA